jgi:outer membrane protein, heavy metal efflux system
MRLAVLPLAGAIGFACSSVPAAAQPSAVQPLTERAAIERLMAADPTLRALNARVDEVRALQAERALYPNPSITYSRESVFQTHDTFLLARQELPVSGRRRQLQTAGRIAVEAAEAESRFRATELQGDLRDAYTDLLLAQEREAALKEGIDRMHKLIAVLRTREEAGEGSAYDRMRGQRALVDLDADLARAATDRARAQGRLAGFLGPNVLPDALAASDRLEADTPPPPLPALLEQALRNRGEYRIAELSVTQFEVEQRAARALRIPTPTVTGGLKRSTTAAASSSGYQFSFDLSVPLFSRGQAATALASAQKARAEAEAASWRARIEAHVRATHTALTIHQSRVMRYRESAGMISESLARTGRIAYDEGELGILELLDAERQALDARLRALELAADARQAAIELDRAIGREIRP